MSYLRPAERGQVQALLLAPLRRRGPLALLSGGYAIPDKGESEDGGEGADPAGLTPEEDGAKGRE